MKKFLAISLAAIVIMTFATTHETDMQLMDKSCSHVQLNAYHACINMYSHTHYDDGDVSYTYTLKKVEYPRCQGMAQQVYYSCINPETVIDNEEKDGQ